MVVPDVASETSRGTMQIINGYIPKDPVAPEMGRNLPDQEHDHEEFTL